MEKEFLLPISDKEELVRKGIPIKKYLSQICTIVKPETILAWNRQMKKGKWNYIKNRQPSKPGRPFKSNDTAVIVCRLASENKDWGYLLILFGNRQLYNSMKVIEMHHNEYRPHQGIGNSIPANYNYPENETAVKEVKCLYHLGGLLKHYYVDRKAA